MSLKRSKRGLSPLIATVVLISATIVGGMLVYNYFQKSFNSVTARSGALEITASVNYLNESYKLVHLVIYNTYNSAVNITNVEGLSTSGSPVHLEVVSAEVGKIVIPAGGKYSIILIAPSSTAAVYVEYTISGSNAVLQSNPVSIS